MPGGVGRGASPLAAMVDNTCNYHLDMQADGNLVEYRGPGTDPSNSVWQTHTNSTNTACSDGTGVGNSCYYTFFQSDGNLVMYDGASGAVITSQQILNKCSVIALPTGTNGTRMVLYPQTPPNVYWVQ